MAVDYVPDLQNRLTDEHTSGSSKKVATHDISSSASVAPRERSHSLLYWMQKAATHVLDTDKHDRYSASRQRSATTSHDDIIRPLGTSFPISQLSHKYGRQRSSTIDSVGSTKNHIPRQKVIISDMDEKAQQSPSIFQFAFGR